MECAHLMVTLLCRELSYVHHTAMFTRLLCALRCAAALNGWHLAHEVLYGVRWVGLHIGCAQPQTRRFSVTGFAHDGCW